MPNQHHTKNNPEVLSENPSDQKEREGRLIDRMLSEVEKVRREREQASIALSREIGQGEYPMTV